MPRPASEPAVATKDAPPVEGLFPVEEEYARCVSALNRTGILTLLPQAGSSGVIGIDGNEYPLPTAAQVEALFAQNSALVRRKMPQGFDRLELTPLALPIPRLMDLLRAAILQHAADGTIYQTRRTPADPLIPVRVNAAKQVWIWETLRLALDTDALVYFPQDYASLQGGQTKGEVIHDGRICAVPGWSVGLVESRPIMAQPGQGETVGGRKQLEISASPREYLQTLQGEVYQGETGKTLEDFITKFLTHLETTNEVSNDVADENALWCLAQYLKISYAEVVPTGRWHRLVGRVRLDSHRTNNKLCAPQWGVSTTVRLPRP